jgi:small GTP-binding protein
MSDTPPKLTTVQRVNSTLAKSQLAQAARKSAYIILKREDNANVQRGKIPFTTKDLHCIMEYAAGTPREVLTMSAVCSEMCEEGQKDWIWLPLCHRTFPSSVQFVKDNAKFACLQMNNYFHTQFRNSKKIKKKSTVEYKIACIGSKNVGKSALALQLLQGRFDDKKYEQQIDDVTITQVSVDDEPFFVDILDTNESEEFQSIQNAYLKNSQGFLLIYDVFDWSSFDKVLDYYESIRKIKEEDWVPMVLVANKSDSDGPKYPPVPIELGRDLAKRLKISFIETSAKDRLNVEEAVHALIRLLNRNVKIYYRECWESILSGKPLTNVSGQKKCLLQ